MPRSAQDSAEALTAWVAELEGKCQALGLVCLQAAGLTDAIASIFAGHALRAGVADSV